MKTLERMPFKGRKAVFEKLEEIADVSALPPEDRRKYEQSLKVYHDHEAVLEAAELTGLEKGIEKGLEKGLEKGIEKGIEKESQRTAREMKMRGLDKTLISEITKLSIEEIENL